MLRTNALRETFKNCEPLKMNFNNLSNPKMPEPPRSIAKGFIQKSLEESIVMALLNLSDSIIKNGDVVCQRMGITTQQWRMMLHLANDPNIPYIDEQPASDRPIVASELANALNVSRPNVTNLINSLIEKGLVSQKEDKKDRRKKFLMLTTEGVKILEEIEPSRRKANRRLLEDFSEEDKTLFLEQLRNCLNIINADFS